MVMESKTTSKTSCLKALLLRAWRERWTDIQWGINIKTVLPRGVSGDVYNLADCILQQAVVGAGANPLVLSYLRHSLSAQLVSHAAVLQRLSKFNQLGKIHCVFSLLEFLSGVLPGVTCCGKPEETVLANAVLSIALWLLNILQHCQNTTAIIQKTSDLLKLLLNDDFYVSLMCLARYNDVELYNETSRKCVEVDGIFPDDSDVKKYVKKLENIDVDMLKLKVNSEPWPGSLIQCWLEVKLIGDPGCSTEILSQQLKIFQKLKNFNDSRLFAEIMRGSLLSLYNVSQTSHESQWGAFAFLKVPHILHKLFSNNKTDTNTIFNAVDLMLQHSPLLDAMDSNSSCSSLNCLLDELAKIRLLTEGQVKILLEKRKSPPIKIDSNNTSNGMVSYWHICAESTLAGILKTLTTDYHKIQDALLKMLHQVLTGKSLELILAVATVQNQLRTLVNRLIKFNECSKSGGDKAKSQLFDITFVMLIAIVQNYGTSNVLDTNGDSLFEQWVKSCMVERQKPKAPDQILKLCDPNIVESLLQQFNSGESDFKPNIKWQDVLYNIPGVMHEVLIAWEQGTLVALDVKRILDAVRGKMCCLPLVAVAWLCSYMHTAPQETLLKPINMIQQLLATPNCEEECLRDRWQLTCEIIRKMQRDVQLPLSNKSLHYLVSKQPATEQLHQAWLLGMNRGWLDHNSAKTLHCLLETAGSHWLVNAIIQELLKVRYRDQLERAVDLALAIFHVDIINCTLQLLSHILPQLLYNDLQADTLLEPQLPALARLTSYCVYTAFDCVEESNNEDEPKLKLQKFDFDEKLTSALHQLLTVLDSTIQEGFITQQTYFAFYLVKSLVEVKSDGANAVLSAIPRGLVSDLLKTMPELFSYSLILHLHDVYSVAGRVSMAKDLCVLRNFYLKNVTS